MGLTVVEPPVVSDPVQAPLLVQVGVVPAIVQVSIELPPLNMVSGFAFKVMVGGVWVTLIVTDLVSVPAMFVQVSI